MIEQIIGGVVGAAFYAFSAWKKSRMNLDGLEKFDWSKMGSTVLLGGVIGAFAGYQGINYNVAVTAGWTAYATIIIENAWKYGYRKVCRIGLDIKNAKNK